MADGTTHTVDAKRRKKEAAEYWTWAKNSRGERVKDPDITFEIFSVLEEGVPGWLFDDRKETDFILFTFDPEVYEGTICISTSRLKKAYSANKDVWEEKYPLKNVPNNGYTTQCRYIPKTVVLLAIAEIACEAA